MVELTEFLNFEVSYLRVVLILISITSTLSLFACLFTIMVFLVRKQSRTFIFELITYLAISETFNAVTKFLSINKLVSEGDQPYTTDNERLLYQLVDHSGTVCYAQRFLGMYSDCCTFMTIVVVSYCLSSLVTKLNRNIERKILWIRLGIFGVPLIISSLYSICTS